MAFVVHAAPGGWAFWIIVNGGVLMAILAGAIGPGRVPKPTASGEGGTDPLPELRNLRQQRSPSRECPQGRRPAETGGGAAGGSDLGPDDTSSD
ncbi:MAG: hypothetical protein WCI73_04610 [Phycisphaerae bacterium]